MSDFEFRGAEFHATRMWEHSHVIRTLDFMQKNGMNTLIFHQNELLDVLVLPQKLYTRDQLWAYWPVRMETASLSRDYIKWVVREAKKRGIDFILQIKEIWFHEALLEIHPELRNADSTVCPTHPFWEEYMEMRLTELFEAIPDIAGITVSLGTRESKVSLAANRCTCERCKNTDPKEWYKWVINAMYRPIKANNKKLIVRDFSYSVEHLNLVVEACKECSEDIVVSLKITPHDFYIPFPTNARIGNTNVKKEYIEYDVWGQFYGMALFPVGIDGDMKARLKECKEKGVAGAYFRTDLETVRESSVYNGFSMLNLYAAAMLTENVDTDIDDIYKAWVRGGITSPLIAGSYDQVPAVPSAPDAWRKFRDFMHAGWQVMLKAQYVRGQMFLKDDQTPDCLAEAFDMLINIHGREPWEPGISRLLDRTDENIKAIIEEKEQALKEVKELPFILDAHNLGLPDAIVKDLDEVMDLYVYYVDMCRVSAEAVFYGQKAIETRDPADIPAVKKSLKALYDFSEKLKKRLEGTSYPHYVYWHFDPSKPVSLAKDIESKLFEK